MELQKTIMEALQTIGLHPEIDGVVVLFKYETLITFITSEPYDDGGAYVRVCICDICRTDGIEISDIAVILRTINEQYYLAQLDYDPQINSVSAYANFVFNDTNSLIYSLEKTLQVMSSMVFRCMHVIELKRNQVMDKYDKGKQKAQQPTINKDICS